MRVGRKRDDRGSVRVKEPPAQLELQPAEVIEPSGELPFGWVWATLDKLLVRSGLFCDGDWVESKDQDPNGKVRLIQLADVGDGAFKDRSNRYLTESKAQELGCSMLKPGDVLIARMPDPLGRACIFPGVSQPCCTVVDVAIFRAGHGDVSSRWLMHVINTPQSRALMASLEKGTTRKRISRKNLCAILFPIPPSREQERIADAVDALLTRLDAAIAGLQRVQANLKRYRASVLQAAVQGRLVPTEAELARQEGREYEPASVLLERILTERRRRWEEAELAKMTAKGKVPKDDGWKAKYEEPCRPSIADAPELPQGWCWARAEQLFWDAGYGTSQKCTPDGSGPPVLRIPNVQAQTISLNDIKYAAGTEKLSADGIVRPGDFLFIRTNGSKNLVGRGATVSQLLPGDHHFASYLIRLRLVQIERLPEWMSLVWHAPIVRDQLLEDAASSAGQHNVSLSAASSYLIPLAPLGEQRRVLNEVERLFSVADSAYAVVQANLLRTSRLRQSILKSAFEGKLVDQDPSDEPASALLARLRAERDPDAHPPTPAASPRSTRKPRARRTKRPPTP